MTAPDASNAVRLTKNELIVLPCTVWIVEGLSFIDDTTPPSENGTDVFAPAENACVTVTVERTGPVPFVEEYVEILNVSYAAGTVIDTVQVNVPPPFAVHPCALDESVATAGEALDVAPLTATSEMLAEWVFGET